ncbi:uncharacterized protein TRIADDRAFT_28123, partial [Trichoplax adhaerens]
QIQSKVKHLQKILAYPPLLTILRVNTVHFTIDEAEKMLRDIIEKRAERKLANLQILRHPVIPDVLMIPAQINNDITVVGKEVIVGSQCGMSVLRGANVFAIGIRGADPNIQIGDTVSVYADIHDICRDGTTAKFTEEKLFVGNGIAKISRRELFKGNNKPRGIAVEVSEPLYLFPALNGIGDEFVFLQNLPSVVASHVLNPHEGDTILDMCSAPGGKATHIATLMKNKGTIIALDKSKSKLHKIKSNAERLNLSCIEVFAFDSTKAVADICQCQEGLRCPPFALESFDRILLDPPCSGMGQRPCLAYKMSAKELRSYSCYQRKLLSQAFQLLKVGGILVYCTCTLTLSENERNISWALSNYPELELCNQSPYLGCPGIQVEGLNKDQANSLQRFDPINIADSILRYHESPGEYFRSECTYSMKFKS